MIATCHYQKNNGAIIPCHYLKKGTHNSVSLLLFTGYKCELFHLSQGLPTGNKIHNFKILMRSTRNLHTFIIHTYDLVIFNISQNVYP